MFQANKPEGRYPNYLTFGWIRSDGDMEVIATLNGDTIEDDNEWNHLVEQTAATLQYIDPETQVFEREDVVSVLVPTGEENFEDQVVDVNLF